MPDQRRSELPVKAKWIIAAVLAVGFLAILSAALEARQVAPVRFLIWALAAGVMGAAKVRFTRIHSCYSLGFVVALAAMATLPLAETAAVSVIAAVSQSYWRPRKRPTLVQAMFNACNYGISGTAGWYAIQIARRWAPASAAMVLGLSVFFLVNSGLVAMILAPLSDRGLAEIWRSSFVRIFPLYLGGAMPALLASLGAMSFALMPIVMLLLAPVTYIVLRVSVPAN
jgi:hypothetical protein